MKTLKEAIGESKPSLVVFIHSGQQTDDEINRNLDELREKYGDRVNVIRVDASYDQRVKRDYKLGTFPTYVLFKEGEELMRESGDKSIGELEELISRAG